MKNYVFGVDVGGTTVKIGLFEASGILVEKWEIPTRKEERGSLILSDIAAAIEQKLDEREIPREDVEGIGLGVPGPVTSDGIVLKCVNLGWGVFNVEKELSQLTGFSAKATNDANAAALGEQWQGGGKGFQDIVLVTLGTGIGGGIIINGKVLSGINGAAGEIGHIAMNDNEPEMCNCGKRGCLEQYASATGVVRLMKRRLAAYAETKGARAEMEGLTAKDVFDAAARGDSIAISAIDEAGHILGKGLAATACVTNPEAFVIGGGMSRAGNLLLEPVRESYRRYAFHAARDTQFVLAKLGNDAGIYGGARLLLSNRDNI